MMKLAHISCVLSLPLPSSTAPVTDWVRGVDSELHPGPNFGTQPDPWTTHDGPWVGSGRKAFKFVFCNKQL